MADRAALAQHHPLPSAVQGCYRCDAPPGVGGVIRRRAPTIRARPRFGPLDAGDDAPRISFKVSERISVETSGLSPMLAPQRSARETQFAASLSTDRPASISAGFIPFNALRRQTISASSSANAASLSEPATTRRNESGYNFHA